jgi:antitoxin CptB
MTTSDDLSRIVWRSHRGMLELDLFLVPFAQGSYQELSEKDRKAYRVLLECEDWEILDWLHYRTQPAGDLASLVDRIRCFREDE